MIPNAFFILINLLCITCTAYVGVNALYEALTAELTGNPVEVRQDLYQPGKAEAGQEPLSAYKGVLDRNLFNTRSETAPQTQKVDVESLKRPSSTSNCGERCTETTAATMRSSRM